MLPVIQTIFFFGTEIFNPQKKKSVKIKCPLFSPKSHNFHTAEITGYTVINKLGNKQLQPLTVCVPFKEYTPSHDYLILKIDEKDEIKIYLYVYII